MTKHSSRDLDGDGANSNFISIFDFPMFIHRWHLEPGADADLGQPSFKRLEKRFGMALSLLTEV